MTEGKPSMSMCINVSDYQTKTIDWQVSKIKLLEDENEKLKWELANTAKELAKVERELFCKS